MARTAEKIFKLGGSVSRRNVHSSVLETHSPTLNFIFGNNWGLPSGFSLLLYGEPKGGKSLVSRSFIGKLHKNNPKAIAIVFDTEFRWQAQLDDNAIAAYGIDENRLQIVPCNHPAEIFDTIEKEVNAACQAGHEVGLIVIDSITEIQGRRGTNQESIMTMQRGDHAATLQDGWKQILPVIRKNNIALILTTQVRAEQDPGKIMQHKTIKPAAAFGTLHFCEYSMFVQAIDSAAGRKTLDGVPLENSSLTVNKKGGEQTGHRIRAKMVGSSMGPKQRIAEFTVDYKNGFINTHEEVFTLGVGSGVIEKPTSMSYVFGDRKWVGSSNIMEALRTDPELCEAVLVEVKKRDLAGTFSGVSESEETVEETETEVE